MEKRENEPTGDSPVKKRPALTQLPDWDHELDDSFIQDLELDCEVAKPTGPLHPSRLQTLDLIVEAVDGSNLTCGQLEDKENRWEVSLGGFWAQAVPAVGTPIRILFPSFRRNTVTIHGDDETLLLVHPDYLVQSTTVAAGTYCSRKAVLNDRFRGLDGGNKWMLIGTLVHGLFQDAAVTPPPLSLAFLRRRLQAVLNDRFRGLDGGNKWMLIGTLVHGLFQDAAVTPPPLSLAFLRRRLQVAMGETKVLLTMTSLRLGVATLTAEIEPYLPGVRDWVSQYLPLPRTSSQKPLVLSGGEEFDVQEIRDIEESVWDPRWGVRGKLDLSLRVRSRRSGKLHHLSLELKTGRSENGFDHQGQVMLYNLMLSSVTETEVNQGLLLYLKSGNTFPVSGNKHLLQGLIQMRNALAVHLSRVSVDGGVFSLPEPIDDAHKCASCPLRVPCTLWHTLFEDGNVAENHVHKTTLAKELVHLDPAHLDFFRKWMRWLCLDWARDLAQRAPVSSLWAPHTNKSNRSLREETMLVDNVGSQENDGVQVRFIRKPGEAESKPIFHQGDMVVASTSAHFALFLAPVVAVDSASVSLRLDRPPPPRIKEVRLTEYHSAATHAIHLVNLVALMTHAPAPHQILMSRSRLRKLLVDRETPRFTASLKRDDLLKIKTELASLNSGQRKAVIRALLAQDYLLIKGLPGSGKTTTVVALIRVLVKLGLRILLTAYTHSAIDNCLLKLIQDDAEMCKSVVRVGSESQVHPGVRRLSLHARLAQFSDPGDKQTRLRELATASDDAEMCESVVRVGSESQVHPGVRRLSLHARLAQISDPGDKQTRLRELATASVLGGTCLEAGKAEGFLSLAGPYDVVIVDEASLCLSSAAIGPLLRVNAETGKFILVGDPKQLQPLVLDRQARQEGMAESLMTTLEGVTEKSVVSLSQQFRMNRTGDWRQICGLSSALFYNGELECGNAGVATATLRSLSTTMEPKPWTEAVFSSVMDKSVVVVDTTDDVGGCEKRGSGLWNRGEVEHVTSLLRALLAAGVGGEEVGVAAFYREQVHGIQDALREPIFQKVEVKTVDQYQGRDKDILIVSFAWTPTSASNPDMTLEPSSVIGEDRRVNVALTRSRKKLILLGHWTGLQLHPTIAALNDLIPKHAILPAL